MDITKLIISTIYDQIDNQYDRYGYDQSNNSYDRYEFDQTNNQHDKYGYVQADNKNYRICRHIVSNWRHHFLW